MKTGNLIGVPQLHPLGCAVACVAYRCGTSYLEALASFAHPEHAWTRGFYCKEVVSALSSSGLKYVFEKYNSSHHPRVVETQGTIVFVAPCIAYPSGHYLIRTKSGWMNPWANFPLMNNIEATTQENLPGEISYIIYEPLL